MYIVFLPVLDRKHVLCQFISIEGLVHMVVLI